MALSSSVFQCTSAPVLGATPWRLGAEMSRTAACGWLSTKQP